MSDQLVTVRRRVVRADDTPAQGTVSLTPVVEAGNTAPEKRLVARCSVSGALDGDGTVSLRVLASDDPDWQTDGPVLYRVEEDIHGAGGWVLNYVVHIPGPGPVDLLDLQPAAVDGQTVAPYPVPGPPGPQAEVTVDPDPITLPPGSPVAVEDLDPSPHAARIRFSIPQGQPGPAGPDTLAGLTDVEDTAATAPVGSLLGVIGAAGRWGYVPRSVRTSRPNGDDRLVEVWTGSTWVVAHYDSGLRDIRDSLNIPEGSGLVVDYASIRRVGPVVECYFDFRWSAPLGSPYSPLMLPAGFRPPATRYGVMRSYASPREWIGFASGEIRAYDLGPSNDGLRSSGSWLTNDPVPASLPGHRMTKAP